MWVDQLARSRSSRQSVDLRSVPLTKAARIQGASAATLGVAAAGALHGGAQSGSTARGGSFAHRRTMQALELTLACVMIVTFLAVAMFV